MEKHRQGLADFIWTDFSLDELMALMQYDRMNFERWVTRGKTLIDKKKMEEAELARILSYFAARFVWGRGVLDREKKYAFVVRWVARRMEKRMRKTAEQFSIWEDVKKEAQRLAIVLGDKNSEEFAVTQRFGRYILSVSPRLAHKDIILIDEEDIRDRVLH